MKLVDAFGLGPRELVALVGGAPRSAVARALARGIAATDRRVVSCATTDVRLPAPDPGEQILADPNPEIVYRDLIERLQYFPRVTVGLGGSGGFVTLRSDEVGRRLRAVPLHLVRAIHRNPSVPFLLVEADTSVDRPLRALVAEELAVPEDATLVVTVAGVEALGRPLDDRTVHRAAVAARRAGAHEGATIDVDVAAAVLLHPEVLEAVVPKGARLVAFVDVPDRSAECLDPARGLAHRLLERGPEGMDRVVLGEARRGNAIEIVRRPGSEDADHAP